MLAAMIGTMILTGVLARALALAPQRAVHSR